MDGCGAGMKLGPGKLPVHVCMFVCAPFLMEVSSPRGEQGNLVRKFPFQGGGNNS